MASTCSSVQTAKISSEILYYITKMRVGKLVLVTVTDCSRGEGIMTRWPERDAAFMIDEKYADPSQDPSTTKNSIPNTKSHN
jgi:hypothetical protein